MMGFLRHGLAGEVYGKIGNFVCYPLNEQPVIRLIGKYKDPATTGQLHNRQKMAVVNAFLKPVKEFIKAGFAIAALDTKSNAYNAAVSFNKVRAIAGAYPNFVMDFEKVLVSSGAGLVAQDPAVMVVAEGLRFTWLTFPEMPWPVANDQVMLIAYFPGLQRAAYILSGASRFTGEQVLSIPADLRNSYMELYISFVSADRKQVANSFYLGNLNR